MKTQFTKKELGTFVVLGAIGCTILIYGLWTLVITPLQVERRKHAAKHAELAQKNVRAREAIGTITAHEKRLATLNEEIAQIAKDYAVRPILGSSYQLGLRARLDPLARKSAFNLRDVTVQNPEPMPRNRPNAPFTLCTAEARGTGSFTQIRDFIALLEYHNPYMHIAGLTVTADPTNPKHHRIAIRIECISAPVTFNTL